MDTTSIILISVFSTLVFVLALVVLYFVLHRKVTIIPQTSQWGSAYTIRERRPFMDLFRRKDKKGRAPIPRRGSDAWDANISEEELGILRPARSNHSRAPSDPFQDPYDPHIPSNIQNRSTSYSSTISHDPSHRPALPQDFSDDEESSLPHYSAPPPTHAYRPGTSTPSTSVADTSQPRFTPTSSPPRHSPPPSIIHHIDSFRLETLETTITDIRLTLDSANTILTQVSDLSSLPEEDDTPPLLTPADLAKINELSSLTTFHTELLQQQQQTGGRGIDAYTTKLPKFKTLVAQGMSIIMAAEGRRTKALGHSGHTLTSNSGNTFASFFSNAPNPSSSSTSATSARPQEVKKTQLLSRYADLKKTESFAKNSLRQIIERREARRGSPGSENREMELEVRMLGLRAFRERVVVGRKLGVEDDDDEGEEIWGLDGVDGEVGGERVVVSPIPPSGRTGRTLVREEDEEEGEVPVPPPPAYDERLEREREALLDSKELN
ncbi:hypothetical protein AOL_s00140g75 [Orbilia oligospora ATCC 24927]|uniref:Uncharacterized protein n=2 Tax=Orbilia oligospora TaxID=2813651 RepID=G1XMA6_ARTOA|nr:hypothetical protein AOL_s00140g75 [Orbilia oligospora ATCC 24927]EGX45759.1 hypothetical protein AOL_s00140g75 [Orbilia oligospora ATCC 24927]KAF3272370.1 hypothetical protein TWF970_010092 [Orbilia oligospora]